MRFWFIELPALIVTVAIWLYRGLVLFLTVGVVIATLWGLAELLLGS